jgi:cholesterol transport system auxiliary component
LKSEHAFRGAALALPLLLAGGCSGFLHSNAAPEQTYYLRATATPAAGAPPALAPALRIATPQADPGLDTAHIVLVQPDHRMSFYTGSRWPAPAPALIEALAVQTLRASGNWASLEDSSSPFQTDYLLKMTLRRFEADYTAGKVPEVHVVLECLVGRRDAREVVASFVVSGSAPAAANRMADVVSAFEQATNTALAALSEQTLQAVRKAAGPQDQNAVNPAPSSSR